MFAFLDISYADMKKKPGETSHQYCVRYASVIKQNMMYTNIRNKDKHPNGIYSQHHIDTSYTANYEACMKYE